MDHRCVSFEGVYFYSSKICFRNTDEISDATFEKVHIFVLPAPNAKFNEQEVTPFAEFWM